MRRRGNYPRSIVTSIKNSPNAAIGVTGTAASTTIAKAVTSPSPTVSTDVAHGCIIKAVYVIISGCGLGGTNVQNNMSLYMFKNPGANLTPPSPFSVGTSNEKKFVFRQWQFMIMPVDEGNAPFHWEGWIKIPKRYQRMGTDDILELAFICTSALTAHLSVQFVYKWYR